VTSAGRLYEEVHHLAYHYHWAERDIMDLPRSKRRRYLGLLASKLENSQQGNNRE
jgi:hypothetical protein